MSLKVLVADDQARMRAAVKSLLSEEPDVSVTLARDGAEAVELSRTQRFDVAVLDIAMPVLSGIVALTMLHREQPHLPVIMLSSRADSTTVKYCLAKGAKAYVAKESAFPELIRAIRAVVAGERYFCRVIRAVLEAIF